MSNKVFGLFFIKRIPCTRGGKLVFEVMWNKVTVGKMDLILVVARKRFPLD